MIKEDEELECFAKGCSNRAEFVDSDGDSYCSVECYIATWPIKEDAKIRLKKIFSCAECRDIIDECNCCGVKFTNQKLPIICDFNQAKHFCSMGCLLEDYNWRRLGSDK